MSGHDTHIRRILDHLGADRPVSQRSLSGDLGIALGLTNLLVRRMTRQGWVRLVRVPPNRYRYFLTPAGLAEKARRSRSYLAHNMQFYAEARDRIRQTFHATSDAWEALVGPAPGALVGPAPKDVVFFSGSEIAEIGYVCLQDSDLRLRGVIDNERHRPFFDVPVHPVDALCGTELAGQRFGVVIVMSFADTGQLQSMLSARGVPDERIVWLV